MYQLPNDDLKALQSYCQEELIGIPVAKRTLSLQLRTRMLERHGEVAALELLHQHLPGAKIINANDTRRNQRGYDLLVNDSLRIQVKGRCWVELIDFSVKPFSNEASWESDLWIAVDFGPLIDGRWGRLAGDNSVAPRHEIDFYIAPTSELRQLVSRKYGKEFNSRTRLWFGKIEKYRRSKYHTSELLKYKNAFHYLNSIK